MSDAELLAAIGQPSSGGIRQVAPARPKPPSASEMPGFKAAVAGAVADVELKKEQQKNEQIRTRAQKSAAEAIAELQTSVDRLANMGSVVRTGDTWYNNPLKYLAATGAGQAVGQFFGTRSQKERDDIASARRSLMSSIAGMTGMSAKQIDSNAELSSMLNSLTDPKASYESQLTSLRTLSKMYGLDPYVKQAIKSHPDYKSTVKAQQDIDQILSKYGVK